MSNLGKGFLASLCLHLALFTAVIAFARAVEPNAVTIVDISFLGLSGSGSGGGGGGMEAGPPENRTDMPSNDAEEQNSLLADSEETRPKPPLAEAASAQPSPPPPEPEPQKPVVPEKPPVEPEDAAAPLKKEPEKRVREDIPQKRLPKEPLRKEEKRPDPPKKQPKKNPQREPKEEKPRPASERPAQQARAQSADASGKSGAPGGEAQPGPGLTQGAPGMPGAGGGTRGGAGGGSTGGSGGGSGKGSAKSYFDYIYAHIRKHLVYPQQARRMGMTGRTHYGFTIEKDGRVTNLSIEKSCGFAMLDEAGLKAIQAASPLPPPQDKAHIVMPISFSLR